MPHTVPLKKEEGCLSEAGKKMLGFVHKAREDWQQHNRKIRQWNKWSRLNISQQMLFHLPEKRQSPARCSIHCSSWNLSLHKRKSYLHNALQGVLLVIPTELGHTVLFKHKLWHFVTVTLLRKQHYIFCSVSSQCNQTTARNNQTESAWNSTGDTGKTNRRFHSILKGLQKSI